MSFGRSTVIRPNEIHRPEYGTIIGRQGGRYLPFLNYRKGHVRILVDCGVAKMNGNVRLTAALDHPGLDASFMILPVSAWYEWEKARPQYFTSPEFGQYPCRRGQTIFRESRIGLIRCLESMGANRRG
jgi:hypothetical protein